MLKAAIQDFVPVGLVFNVHAFRLHHSGARGEIMKYFSCGTVVACVS
jgi:hypothetical protein